MKTFEVFPAGAGRWMYAVYVGERPVVVGIAVTRERAVHEASLA